MPEMLEESGSLESTTVGVYRTAATVKGGRRFSFSSLVVVGDRNGRVGFGYGKANQVPPAIEKAQKSAKRTMRNYPLLGRTIPHEVTGRFGACKVRLIPAAPGTGVIAGAAVRAPLEMVGIQDCLTKSFGSNNSKNLVKAVIDGLNQLKPKSLIEELRGIDVGATAIEESVERGREFLPAASSGTKAVAPTNKRDEEAKAARKQRGGRGGPRGGRGGGRGGDGGRGPKADAPAAAESKPATPAPEAPAAEAKPEGDKG